jgi:hypothetical protein
VKPPETAELVPPAVVTVTATLPAACAGVEKVSEVAELTVTEAAGIVVPPIVTVVAPETKFAPVIVTLVPPAIGPTAGDIEATVGTLTLQTICTFVTFAITLLPDAFVMLHASFVGC